MSKRKQQDDPRYPDVFPGWSYFDDWRSMGEGYRLDLNQDGAVVVHSRIDGATSEQALARIRSLAMGDNIRAEQARRALVLLGDPNPLPPQPDTPAPVAALRWTRDALLAARGSGGGGLSISSDTVDRILIVVQRAVRHHWNDACFSNMDCECGRCVVCGEPEAVQRTSADRYDEEFPDSDQGPDSCSGCGCTMDLRSLRAA